MQKTVEVKHPTFFLNRLPVGGWRRFLRAPAQQTQIQYLSGTDKDHTVPWQFSVSSGTTRGSPRPLRCPPAGPARVWDFSKRVGHDQFQCGNGFLHQYVCGAFGLGGQGIFLVFEGVLTDTSASINGHSVGSTHQGGYYEFRYDVTPYVVVGASTNVLTVTVRKFSANSFVEGAEQGNVDYWKFGGIYRPVYLEAKPAAYIDYMAANPLANGNITNAVYLGGITANYSVQAFVTDTNMFNWAMFFQFGLRRGDERGAFGLAADAQCVVCRISDPLYFDGPTGGYERRGGAQRDEPDWFSHHNFRCATRLLCQWQKSDHARRLSS